MTPLPVATAGGGDKSPSVVKKSSTGSETTTPAKKWAILEHGNVDLRVFPEEKKLKLTILDIFFGWNARFGAFSQLKNFISKKKRKINYFVKKSKKKLLFFKLWFSHWNQQNFKFASFFSIKKIRFFSEKFRVFSWFFYTEKPEKSKKKS